MSVAVFVDTESLVGSLGKGFTAVDIDAAVAAACGDCCIDPTSVAHFAVYAPWWLDHEGLAEVEATVKAPPATLVSTKFVKGKSVLDTHLAIDAAVYDVTTGADTYMIVSSDADMVPLVDRLKRSGRKVVGVGRTGSTKPETARSYDRFVWFSAEQLVQLQPSTGGLTGDAARLRRWVEHILDGHQELPSAYVAHRLAARVQTEIRKPLKDVAEAAVGERAFKKAIMKLFPGGEIRFRQDGVIERSPDEEEPRASGGFVFRGVTTEVHEVGLEDADVEEWDPDRWSLLTLPMLACAKGDN